MPSPMSVKLSNVALEYLRNHDELEFARNQFFEQRKKLLEGLGNIMLEAAAAHGQAIDKSIYSNDCGYFDVYTRGRFHVARARAGKEKRSGYSIALGSTLEHVGAQALLWFEVRLTSTRRQQLEISGLEKTLGANVKAFEESSWTYIRIAAQPSSNLDLEALEAEARRLPASFATADDWLARRVKD